MTLDAEDVKAIARQVVVEMRAEQVAISQAPVLNTGKLVKLDEAMAMVSANSLPSFYRTMKEMGIRPFRRGVYRWNDINNGIARRGLKKGKAAA